MTHTDVDEISFIWVFVGKWIGIVSSQHSDVNWELLQTRI